MATLLEITKAQIPAPETKPDVVVAPTIAPVRVFPEFIPAPDDAPAPPPGQIPGVIYLPQKVNFPLDIL